MVENMPPFFCYCFSLYLIRFFKPISIEMWCNTFQIHSLNINNGRLSTWPALNELLHDMFYFFFGYNNMTSQKIMPTNYIEPCFKATVILFYKQQMRFFYTKQTKWISNSIFLFKVLFFPFKNFLNARNRYWNARKNILKVVLLNVGFYF